MNREIGFGVERFDRKLRVPWVELLWYINKYKHRCILCMHAEYECACVCVCMMCVCVCVFIYMTAVRRVSE